MQYTAAAAAAAGDELRVRISNELVDVHHSISTAVTRQRRRPNRITRQLIYNNELGWT